MDSNTENTEFENYLEHKNNNRTPETLPHRKLSLRPNARQTSNLLQMEPPPASAVFEATPKPNMLFSTCKQTHTITETNKRSRSSSSDDHTQPPSKIRKESQDIVNKLNGLNTILTKNVAKGVSKVFRVHSNVKGSIAMHTGGVMYV